MPPEATTKYLTVLQKSHGSVYFASADWSDGWCGWIDGAVQSGMEMAREVMKKLGASSDSQRETASELYINGVKAAGISKAIPNGVNH